MRKSNKSSGLHLLHFTLLVLSTFIFCIGYGQQHKWVKSFGNGNGNWFADENQPETKSNSRVRLHSWQDGKKGRCYLPLFKNAIGNTTAQAAGIILPGMNQNFWQRNESGKKIQPGRTDLVAMNRRQADHSLSEKVPEPEVMRIPPGICNEFFIGPATIFEDSYERFNLTGANVAYTHRITDKLGITGDAGIYFGSQHSIHYTKLQLLSGISLYTNSDPGRISMIPHLLAGIVNIRSRFTGGSNAYENSSTHLSVAAGTDVSFPLGNNKRIVLRADYNPVFYSGEANHNFRLGAGITFPIGCPGNSILPVNKELPPVMANVTARDFNPAPPLYRPDDKNLTTPLNKMSRTQAARCEDENGGEVFEYNNNAEKSVDATLVVKNSGQCKIRVEVENVTRDPVKDLFGYGILPGEVQGSDIHSFTVPKGMKIRVSIYCWEGTGPCDFTRDFSVTTAEDVDVAEPNAPKIAVAPPTNVDQLEIYNPTGNRCMSKDMVFYQITNRDVRYRMKVGFKAVSECPCYFEAYADVSRGQPPGEPKPRRGKNLGADEENNPAPAEIAKPAKNVESNSGSEQFVVVPKGRTVYLKGRCPTQQPAPGPCRGHIEITGISYIK